MHTSDLRKKFTLRKIVIYNLKIIWKKGREKRWERGEEREKEKERFKNRLKNLSLMLKPWILKYPVKRSIAAIFIQLSLFPEFNRNVRRKTRPEVGERMWRTKLRDANVIKSYEHKNRSFPKRKKMPLVNRPRRFFTFCLFHSSSVLGSGAMTKRNGRKESDANGKTRREWKARGKHRACNSLCKEHLDDN